MSDHSAIEWTDASWTPIRARNLKTGKVGWHCEHDTTGCEFCYAEGFNKRLGTGLPFKPGHRKDLEIFLDDEMLTAPLRWKKSRKIFVCSMTDAFASFVPDEWLDKMFAVMALCPQHTFQVLTKRAERMREYLTGSHRIRQAAEVALIFNRKIGGDRPWDGARAVAAIHTPMPLPNVWLGVSAERQQEADERIPHLLQTPAAVRFVSAEPLLGPIDLDLPLNGWTDEGEPRPRLNWIIVGGESGPGARPFYLPWARSLRDQCSESGVAFFFKQHGEWLDGTQYTDAHRARDPELEQSRFSCMDWDGERYIESGSMWCDDIDEHAVYRVGKKAAGRLLDGREHNQFPDGVRP